MNTGDEVEAETKAFKTASITSCADGGYVEPAYDVLDVKTQPGQGAVG